MPVKEVFKALPEWKQHELTFGPKDWELFDRLRFWQQQLQPALPPKLYHQAMIVLIQWARRIAARRRVFVHEIQD